MLSDKKETSLFLSWVLRIRSMFQQVQEPILLSVVQEFWLNPIPIKPAVPLSKLAKELWVQRN